jgi:TonB family protein
MNHSLTRVCILSAALASTLAAVVEAQQPLEPRPHAQVLQKVPPVYPPLARSRGVEGDVVAWVYVDAEGKVTKVRIRKSPHELLSDAAEAALLKWKFMPAVKEGKAAESISEYLITFHLTDPDVPLEPGSAAPDAGTVSRYVSSMEGAEAFRTEYWKTERHKAFASAESGAWGWAAARSSPEQAVQSALETCERVRDRLTSACRIVDIDGQWQASTDRTSTRLSKLTPLEMSYYRRRKVEEWPEPKKSNALALLDECRAESESFLQTWKTQDPDAIYKAVAQEMRDQYPIEEFQRVLEAMKLVGGAITHATFNDQSLVTRKGDEELRLDQGSIVSYLATTAAQSSEILLTIILARESGKCRVTGFQYFAPGAMPPWLQDEAGKRERGT